MSSYWNVSCIKMIIYSYKNVSSLHPQVQDALFGYDLLTSHLQTTSLLDIGHFPFFCGYILVFGHVFSMQLFYYVR